MYCPAWDIAAGLYLTTGLLAAERARQRDGRGREVTLALSDVMLASVSNLGYIADVQVNGTVRPPMGNDLYGALGRDFGTADGRRVMIVAISNRQWRAIGNATGLADKLAMIGPMMEVDLDTEGGRFEARAAIFALLESWCGRRSLAEITACLEGSGVLWGPYQDFGQLVQEDVTVLPSPIPCSARSSSPGAGGRARRRVTARVHPRRPPAACGCAGDGPGYGCGAGGGARTVGRGDRPGCMILASLPGRPKGW